jgi:hypothetical protein
MWKKKILNEGNQKHNLISSSGSGTVINYGSGSDYLTSYGSGSTRQKVTVPTVPVPQHWRHVRIFPSSLCMHAYLREWNVPLELEGELLAPVGRLVFRAHQHVVEQEQVTQLSSSVWLKGQLTYTAITLFKGTDNCYRECWCIFK